MKTNWQVSKGFRKLFNSNVHMWIFEADPPKALPFRIPPSNGPQLRAKERVRDQCKGNNIAD
jgi:hypothetical protein